MAIPTFLSSQERHCKPHCLSHLKADQTKYWRIHSGERPCRESIRGWTLDRPWLVFLSLILRSSIFHRNLHILSKTQLFLLHSVSAIETFLDRDGNLGISIASGCVSVPSYISINVKTMFLALSLQGLRTRVHSDARAWLFLLRVWICWEQKTARVEKPWQDEILARNGVGKPLRSVNFYSCVTGIASTTQSASMHRQPFPGMPPRSSRALPARPKQIISALCVSVVKWDIKWKLISYWSS